MVQIARINNESSADDGRHDETSFLDIRDNFFGIASSLHGNSAIGVVGSKSNALNKRALGRGTALCTVKQIVNHVVGASSSSIVNLVAHVTIRIESGWIVLKRASKKKGG